MRSGGLLSGIRFTPRGKAGALSATVWAVLLAIVFLLSMAGDARAEYVTEGYGGPSFAAAGVIAPTGDKPQSKLWYAQDSWWGSLFVPGSLAANGQAGFKIHRLEWSTQEWIDTQVLVDARPDGRMDVLWDGASLYVASAGMNPADTGDSVQISRFTWDAAAGEYVLSPGFPVTIVDGGVEAVVLDKDTTGTLWITYTRDLKVYVARTTTDDATWGTPFVIPVPEALGLSADDISAIVAFKGKIGVMWSSTADWNAHSMFFATHVDGAADGAWTVEPALQLPGYVDDHINLKSLQTNNRGQVYAATKTSLTGAADDLILLLVLSKQGAWQRYTFSVAADEQTRPLVLLDPTSDRIHMFASAPGGPGGVVYYKSSPMNRVSFGSGPGTPFLLSETDVNINNAASTKQTVSPTTGLVVIAADDHTKRYLHNSIDLGIVDTIPPDTKILSAPLDREPVFSPTFEFESNEDGVTFEVSVDGGEYVVSGATYTASRLSVGAHTLSVRAVDATGNIDPVPAQWSWEVDPFVVNFSTVADAYFDQATPSINYGSDRNLIVDGVTTGTNESRAVLRFDVPPGAGTPVSAAVHLYAHNGVSVNGPFIYLTSDPWDETTVNWVNQPGTPDPPLSQDASIPVNTWGSFDVTAAVGAGGTYDFLLDQSSSDGVFFYAREVPLYRPHITLTYATAPNFPPEIDPLADVQGYQGAEITFQAVGWDPMGDELTFSLTDAPAAAVVDPVTGVFSWISGIGDTPGVYLVTIRVTDPDGLYAETSLAVTVLQSMSVSGTISSRDTLLPLAGVEVGAYDLTGTLVASSVTSAEGQYTIIGLPAGDYRVRTTSNPFGFYDEWYDNVLVTHDPDGAAAAVLGVAGDVIGVDFALGPYIGLSIAGTVIDEQTALGIPGVAVILYDDQGGIVASKTTDSNGAYSFYPVAPGDYRVRTDSWTHANEWYDNVPYDLDPDGLTATVLSIIKDTTAIDITLGTYPTISGIVTDAVTTLPIWAMGLNAVDGGGNIVSFASTDSNGAYVFSDLPPGDYRIRTSGAQSQGYIEEWYDDVLFSSDPEGTGATVVTLAGDVNGIDLALTPGYVISGVVMDADTALPIEGIEVWVFDDAEALVGSVLTDSSGSYSVVGLPPGDYRVRTNKTGNQSDLLLDEWYDDVLVATDPTGAGATVITLAGDRSDIHFSLGSLRAISGRVTDAGSLAGIEGVEVRLTAPSDETTLDYATTDADGYYTFTHLMVGQYRVHTSNPLGYLDEWYDDVLKVVDLHGTTATVLDVSDDLTGVDFDLILLTSSTLPVSGAVRDGSGAAIVGAAVQALSDAGAVMDWTATDSVGAYTLAGLPPGRYRFQAFMDGYYGEWWDDVRVLDDPDGIAATPIILTAEITGLDFVLAEVPTAISRPVVAGWSLLAGAPGSDILGETAFAYAGGVYQSTSGASFVAGLGYWVRFAEAGTVTLQSVAAPVDVHLSAGWNLIGNPTQDTLALPAGLTAFIFVDGLYVTSDTLEPGQGAWVRSASEQDIVLEVAG